jgi:hypothetical protein
MLISHLEAFENRVDALVQRGAGDRLTALRWLVEAIEPRASVLELGPKYVCHRLDIPATASILFAKAVEELRVKDRCKALINID